MMNLSSITKIFLLMVGILFFQCTEQKIYPIGQNKNVIQKMEAKRPVLIGFIGGSITQGSAASTIGMRYTNQVINKLKLKYRYNDIRLVNAGIGATTSEIATYRAQKDLLSSSPDLVFVDFSVNDSQDEKYIETYEGLIRQIMNQTEVVSIILTRKNFSDSEEQHRKITDYYGISTISIKDTLDNLLNTGFKWEDFYNDDVHPNDNGHNLIADIIVDQLSFSENHYESRAPLTENKYQNTKIFYANELQINKSLFYSLVSDSPRFGSAYRSIMDNSLIEFNFEGEYLSILYLRDSKSGFAEVTIDEKSYLINAFTQNEGGFPVVFDFGKIGSGEHRVTITNQGKFEFNAFMSYNLK